ncbi:4-hydroxythreonine-4-phosphate dehydrogenase PdxA [Sneathiella glossodoripedis]|uniref:4-hydroxythreonine-4-phosphate dehydrogenase PdxA n=1 Tax=Sneathiella glossodoripedis TaxID=418853 RepID=UPI0004722F7E|nr:4-hydroxythreonine-4-phosphate dehydrogenase PdxA [Sneathiella glossodoripedis]
MREKPLLVTMGDPNGIGLEITFKAWKQRKTEQLPDFILVGATSRVEAALNLLKMDIPTAILRSPNEDCDPSRLNIIDIGENNQSPAEETIQSIVMATNYCMNGEARALITNPIQKKRLYEAGFKHPGHTEFLAELTGSPDKSVMMLACPGLRVVPATIHIPLAQVKQTLTADRLEAVVRTTYRDLVTRFAIREPHLVIAGLNPHAGEDGSIGQEEIEIIQPLVNRLKSEGMNISGPYPADSLFHEKMRKSYDAAICMYHDQALIPLKTIDFDKGVNITLGLPIIRTSPDHGTAEDIFGKGLANPASLIEAIKAADLMSRTQGDRS